MKQEGTFGRRWMPRLHPSTVTYLSSNSKHHIFFKQKAEQFIVSHRIVSPIPNLPIGFPLNFPSVCYHFYIKARRQRQRQHNQINTIMLFKFVAGPRKKKPGTVPVYLNVYDLTPINGYAYWLGLGVYHSGVQVHGIEYGFGAHENDTTGIFEVQPKHCPGFTFRKSIFIGTTDLGPKDVRSFMEKLAQEYSGNTYHLISKNCNHFCNDVCLKLTGKSIPRWVNRLARLGLFCNCVLPPGLNETKVRQVTSERVHEGEKRKTRSQSSRHDASSNPPLSSRPPGSARHCLPPTSLVNTSSTSTLTVK